ncbi:MAG: hypothetical protein Q9Q13_03540 [Acidobacteriota bacterium]|nr:hypothetical protein [Acidobacteriota bacterium]
MLHGRDPETGEGRVLVRAEEGRAGSLVLEVRDEGPGPGAVDGQWPQGHALENVASRVDAFCGGRLVVGPAAPGPGTTARIVLTSQGD